MSNIKDTEDKVFITTGGFVFSAFIYVWVALEILVGDLPSKGNHYSSTFYDNNIGFFWAMVAIPAGYGLYLLAGAIKSRRRQRATIRPSIENGDLSIDGFINICTATCLILTGLCFAVLPIIEIENGQIYGGQIFKNHLLTAEPEVFWQLIGFHFIFVLLPTAGGLLLLLFPPKRMQPSEQKLNYHEQF